MNSWTIWFKPAEAETWQPLERYRSLPVGHYRLAARFPRPFKRLDWRWKFYPQVGEIQYYDFHGQTNAEGLISLLDLNTVQPGTWQLIGRPDVFDELGGESWQIDHQFQIIPNLAAALIIPPLIPSPHYVAVIEQSRSATPCEIAELGKAVNEIVPHHPPLTEAIAHQVNDPSNEEDQSLDLDPSERKHETLDNHVLVSSGGGLVNDHTAQVTELTDIDHHDDPADSLEMAAALTNQIDDPAIASASPFVLEPVTTESAKTQFTVLAEPDFVPEEEILADISHFRPVSYVLKLIDPEKAATYQVDITVMLDDRRPAVPLDLPNPRQMVRLLHRPIPKPKSPLPPKLSKV